MSNFLPQADGWIDKLTFFKYKDCICCSLADAAFILSIIGLIWCCGFVGYGWGMYGFGYSGCTFFFNLYTILQTVSYLACAILQLVAFILFFIVFILKKGNDMLRLGCVLYFLKIAIWIILGLVNFVLSLINWINCGNGCVYMGCSYMLGYFLQTVIWWILMVFLDICWLWLYWANFRGQGGSSSFAVVPKVDEDIERIADEKRKETLANNEKNKGSQPERKSKTPSRKTPKEKPIDKTGELPNAEPKVKPKSRKEKSRGKSNGDKNLPKERPKSAPKPAK